MDSKEKRAIRRMRALKGGRFILDLRSGSGVNCRIVDIHSRGARLRFDAPVAFGSEKAEVIIFPENKRVAGRVAWQRGMDLGIEFDSPLEWLAKHGAGAPLPAALPDFRHACLGGGFSPSCSFTKRS